jgi:hypothetical protein
MKKRFTGKITGVFLIAAIILGSTAVLGVVMAAAQGSADKAVVINQLSGGRITANGELALNPTPPPLQQSVGEPRPQDMSEDDAFDVATGEISRIFNLDASDYDRQQTSYVQSFNGDEPGAKWEMLISNERHSFFVVLDAVTGQIYLLHFSDYTKPFEEDSRLRYSPTPGDNTYDEAAAAAMSTVNSQAAIIKTRFFIDGFNDNQKVFWIAVSLDDGNDYLIGITKTDRIFVGYSFNEGRIDEKLFNQ